MRVRAIFGPPGTGKTTRLIEEASRITGRNVAFLSFTRAAAKEAASRAGNVWGHASTLHSLIYGHMNLAQASVVNSYKLAEFQSLVGVPFKKGADEENQEGDEYMAVLSYAINKRIHVMDAYDLFNRPGTTSKFATFIASYISWKTAYGYVDFNDMLEVGLKIKFKSFDAVFLDEAQDLSPLQWAVFERVIQGCSEVIIAGDDDQAIFEWSGADPHGMDDFTTRYAGDVTVLAQSWRVPRSAHDLAHDVALATISRRVDKKFDPTGIEGDIVEYADIDNSQGLARMCSNPGSTMILVRDRWRLREVQRLLHQHYVPYSMEGGTSPYENSLADAIRGWRSANPTETQTDAMMRCAVDKHLSVAELKKADWRMAFKIPTYLVDFYAGADLFSPINVKLSTIHQAKGREADNVVLDLTMSPKVENAMYDNPDAEARVLYVSLTRNRQRLMLCGDNPLMHFGDFK